MENISECIQKKISCGMFSNAAQRHTAPLPLNSLFLKWLKQKDDVPENVVKIVIKGRPTSVKAEAAKSVCHCEVNTQPHKKGGVTTI